MRLFISRENIVFPFELLLNVEKSSIPFSTEVTETTIEIAGVSGEVQVDKRYAAGMHNLVLWSWPNATEDEKDMLCKQVIDFWVEALDTPQELHYERFERTYYVKAVGVPERPREVAGLIEFSLPLKAHDPFGYRDNEFSARNVGEFIQNRGNEETPARIEFMGPCTNPSVTINGTVYGYTGTVPNGQILRVDAKGHTVDFYNPATSTSSYDNTLTWNDNFLIVPPASKIVTQIQSIQNAAGKVTVYWRDRFA